MARIRTIKPEFWCSEQVVECSTNARLLFIGLWNFCDDQGVHPASYKRLKMEVFPGDDFGTECIEKYINELLVNNLIGTFVHEGTEYWFVKSWAKHQKIDRPSNRYPRPPFGEHSSNAQGMNTVEPSNATPRKGREGNGRESKGREGNIQSDQIRTESDRSRTGSKPDLSMIDAQFENWWERYPNKQGKERARKKYCKLSLTERSSLLDATINYVDHVESGGNGGKFQHGSTFINENWRDWVSPDPETISASIGKEVSAKDRDMQAADKRLSEWANN